MTSWKHWTAASSAGIAALCAAFLAGRAMAPNRVVTKDVIKTQTVEVERVRTVTVKEQVAAKETTAAARTVTVVKYKWLPGGVVEAVQTTQAATDTTAHETKQERAVATKDVLATKELRLDESRTVERTARPDWSVALLPGVDLTGSANLLPYHGVVGAVLERRIIGPFSLGVWGNTAGHVGASLRMEF